MMRAPSRAIVASLVLAGLVALAGCQRGGPRPSAGFYARAQEIRITGTYHHPASGMEFPPKIGEFERTSLVRYEQSGRNVSARYEISSGVSRIVAAVYVYPAAPVTGSMRDERCASQLDAATADMARTHVGLHRIGLDDVTLDQGGLHSGRRADFEYDEKLSLDSLPATGQIYLFCRASDGWQVEYRFTRPRELNAAPIIDDFLHRLPWTLHAG